MNYKIELNIGSISSPVKDGGYVEVNADVKGFGVAKELEQDNIFARVKVDGNIEYVGNVFTALDTLRQTTAKVSMRITHVDNHGTESVQCIADLNLWGNYKENACTLKAKVNDEYTTLLLKKNEKINVLNTPAVAKCDVQPAQNKLTFYDTNVAQSSLWYNLGTVNTYAREERTYADHVADLLEGTDGWAIIETYDNGTKKLARTWQDGGFDTVNGVTDIIYFPSGTPPEYEINDIVYVDGVECTVVWLFNTQSTLLRNVAYYGNDVITFGRLRTVKDVIKYMIGELDPSILFDSDSFAYLDANEDLAHLLMINVADMMYSGTPSTQTTSVAEFLNISFEKLMKLFREKFKIYWRLELIGSSYYFRLKHRSEINYTLGTLDLTSFGEYSRNFTRDIWSYSDVKKFYRLERTPSEAGNIDFIGADIFVRSLENVTDEQVMSDDSVFFDVWHILEQQGEIYPESTDSQYVLIASEPIETDGVEQLADFSNVGLETLNWDAGTRILQCENTVTWGYAQAVAWSAVAGYVYKITLNLTSHTGERPYVEIPLSNFPNTYLQDGTNTFYVLRTSYTDGPMTMKIHAVTGSPSTFTIADVSVERQVYNCRIRKGALSGEYYANAELSIANIDAGHGQYELPDTKAEINFEEISLTTLQRLKDKEQEIAVPLYDINQIDEEKLIKTNKGNVEFRSHSIKLDGSMPTMKCAFL